MVFVVGETFANTCENLQDSCLEPLVSLVFPFFQSEGSNSQVNRIIGNKDLRFLDPFLLFDHFRSEPPGGFPDHPHRGFTTLTYMLNGTCQHEDFLGNKGEVSSGDLQYMNAGKGIVHAEMPKDGPMNGIQLWVNLHSSHKLLPPSYQELKSSNFPIILSDKYKVKVVIGSFLNENSPIKPTSPLNFFDIEIQEKGEIEYKVLDNWSCFVYTISGEIAIGDKKIFENSAGVIGNGEIVISGKGIGVNRFLIVAGEKIGEKVVQRGPFVMNSEEEIRKTYKDFQGFANGFENARGWRSKFA